MVSLKKLPFIALPLAFVLFFGNLGTSRAQSHSPLLLDAKRIRWSHLVFGAESVWVDVKVDVRLESQSKEKIQAELLENRQGDAIPIPEAGGYRLTTDIESDAAFKAKVNKHNLVWFIPRDGTALGRFRLRQGKDDFKKVYRFTRQGVFRYRQEPKNKQEARKEPDQWTDILDTFYSYAPAQLGCTNVTDRLLLIYIAAASGMPENKQPLSVCAFGKRALFHVKLKPAGLESIKAEFTEIKNQIETRRQGKINAFKIDLETQQLPSDLGIDENFSFLGLRKNISIYLEPETNLPIQISGEISSDRKAVLPLQRAQIE